MVHLPGSVPPGRTAPQIPESWSSAGSATMFPFGIVVHSPVPRPLAPSDSTSWQNTPLADTKPSRSSRCSCMPGLVPSTQRYAADAWLHVSSCVFPLHEIVPRNLETNYANNSNSISFVVVPATKVTFMSLGSKIDSIRYEKNATNWLMSRL